MRDLSLKQAVVEAQRRFGRKSISVRNGYCSLFDAKNGKDGKPLPRPCTGFKAHGKGCPGGEPLCTVGVVEMGMINMIKGEGRTFRDAFDDIDRRAAWSKWSYDQTPGAREQLDAVNKLGAALRAAGKEFQDAQQRSAGMAQA